MSVPARTLTPAPKPRTKAAATATAPKLRPKPQPKPHTKDKPRPQGSASPARTPAARPRPSNPPQSRRRARRGHHPVFWIFSAAVVSVLVVGLVALNALLVQTTYRMQSIQGAVSDLADQQKLLDDQAATLSSPERVAEWAREHGMVAPLPGDTVILRVPGVLTPTDPADGATP